MNDEILFTPSSLVELLSQVEELNGLDITVSESEGVITLGIGDTNYQISTSNAEEVEVDEEAIEQVAEVNDSVYDEFEAEDEAVEGGLIKELAKSLLVGGLVRLTNKYMSKDQFDAYAEQARGYRRQKEWDMREQINPVILGTFTGKCCDGNVFNNNDMKLSTELFENLFASDEFKNAMKNRYYLGYLGHPNDPGCMDYRNACIVMTECHLESNGDVVGTFDLVDTPVGKVVKSFIDAGVTFGISIRGAGDVDSEGNVDPESFVFRGFDLVTFPAYDDCVPEFQEIAASSDLDKQVKYKKVCASVMSNLQSITSAESLKTLKEQFKEGTKEYKAIDDRLQSLAASETLDLTDEKVRGLTKLYASATKEIDDLKERVAELSRQLKDEKFKSYNTEVACSKKIASVKRIAREQLRDVNEELSTVTASCDMYKRRALKFERQNGEFSQQIQSLKASNLKYNQKIEASSIAISQKDSTISELEQQLHETVVANTQFKKEASNRDDNVRSLQKRVEAAEQMVLDYQEAYANMYANALGVHLSDFSISASTSVKDLQKLITAKTVSSSEYSDFDELEIADSDDDIATI